MKSAEKAAEKPTKEEEKEEKPAKEAEKEEKPAEKEAEKEEKPAKEEEKEEKPAEKEEKEEEKPAEKEAEKEEEEEEAPKKVVAVPTVPPQLAITAQMQTVTPHSVTVLVSANRPTNVYCAATIKGARSTGSVRSGLTAVKTHSSITLTGLKPRRMYRVTCQAEGKESAPITITTVSRIRPRAT